MDAGRLPAWDKEMNLIKTAALLAFLTALFMGVAVVLVTGILMLAASKKALVPGRLQSVGEMWYQFIHNMVRQVLGHEGRKFFPLVFSLFSFVLVALRLEPDVAVETDPRLLATAARSRSASNSRRFSAKPRI